MQLAVDDHTAPTTLEGSSAMTLLTRVYGAAMMNGRANNSIPKPRGQDYGIQDSPTSRRPPPRHLYCNTTANSSVDHLREAQYNMTALATKRKTVLLSQA